MQKAIAMITDKTGLPIGMVITLLVSVAGGAGFITKLDYQVVQNTEDLSKVEDIRKDVKVIREDLSFIKGRLGFDQK